tara:strand:- start:420 stop:932 length:513 start_codon:yes stop_codon:yes gene_type:complete
MSLITRKEAAEKMGITIQAVYMAIKQGRLTAMEDSQGNIVINSDTMVAEMKKNGQYRRMKNNAVLPSTSASPKKKRYSSTKDSIPEYEESKARTEHLKAELLELERKQKEDSLVSMQEVQLKWTEIITTARTKLLGISSKAKQRLPDLDTNAVSCIDDIVREALEELSAA